MHKIYSFQLQVKPSKPIILSPKTVFFGFVCSYQRYIVTHVFILACPSKPRAYGVRMNCNVSGDTTVCKATCRSGLTFVPGHPSLEHYICGQATNYIWNGHPPSCSSKKRKKCIYKLKHTLQNPLLQAYWQFKKTNKMQLLTIFCQLMFNTCRNRTVHVTQ